MKIPVTMFYVVIQDMARTKQTARKVTRGGKAPRKNHASKRKDNSTPILFEEMSLDQLKEKQKELGIKDSDINGSGKNGGILKSDRINALEGANNDENDIATESENDVTSSRGGSTSGKKSKALKKESSHPTYKVMIGKAILAEKSKKGSTRQYLKKYLETNYRIDPKSHYLKKEITKLTSLTTGARLIVDPKHTGHYRLSEEYKDEILGKKTKTDTKSLGSQSKYYLFYLYGSTSDDDAPLYYDSIIEAKDENEALKIAKKELKDEDFTKEDWDSLRVTEFKMIKRK
jgi:hypothetical protein